MCDHNLNKTNEELPGFTKQHSKTATRGKVPDFCITSFWVVTELAHGFYLQRLHRGSQSNPWNAGETGPGHGTHNLKPCFILSARMVYLSLKVRGEFIKLGSSVLNRPTCHWSLSGSKSNLDISSPARKQLVILGLGETLGCGSLTPGYCYHWATQLWKESSQRWAMKERTGVTRKMPRADRAGPRGSGLQATPRHLQSGENMPKDLTVEDTNWVWISNDEHHNSKTYTTGRCR